MINRLYRDGDARYVNLAIDRNFPSDVARGGVELSKLSRGVVVVVDVGLSCCRCLVMESGRSKKTLN
jgi:hypothetical protein